ncbi:Zinc-binding dehydrogenase [Ceratobasidium sp. AG-Ba]|nr:Zinc-binding dehydrogenase [Ceratobasidium sp. AG-Ba]
MPRPTLLQAIFHQPTKSYVAPDTAYAQPANKGWPTSATLKRSTGARDVANGQSHSPISVVGDAKAGSGMGPINPASDSKARGRSLARPAALDMNKAEIVAAVPTLSFLTSHSDSPLSSVTASPSPTPPLVSPASTPKSSTPSFTDDTSDSSVDPDFFTPPGSPKPLARTAPLKDVPVSDTQTLPVPTDSLLLGATAALSEKRPPMISSNSSSSSSDHNSLFSGSSHSSDTDATSRRSSPVSEPSPKSIRSPTPTARPHGVRPTPLSGVPDWAKDVRWLVGPQPAAKRAALSALADPNYVPVRGHARSVTAPNRAGPSSASSSRSSYSAGSVDSRRQFVNQFGVYTHSSRSNSRRSGLKRMRAATEGHRSGYRMSALVEVSESEEAGEVRAELADGVARKRSTSQQRAARTRPLSIRSSSSTSSSRTVVLPTPLPVSAGAESTVGAGYTSLTLPRAAYTPSKTPDRPTSVVDLTKSGLAQTTMTTISVIRGTGTRSRRISLSLSLNSSRSSLRSGISSRNSSISSLGPGAGPSIPLALRLIELEGALGLSSHLAPPQKVQSSQVIVQVCAVALDALDALIISERMGKGGSEGAGFVPGRSFVGRAVECGFEVSNVSRGDWVIGLTDIRKCGALAEFVVVDKRRVCTIPRPSDRLTTTQYALLPLCAVPAHRAVRTIPSGARRGMRALVLQAHDGPGALAVQAMRALGMHVTAHVPAGIPTEAVDGVEIVVGDDPVEVVARLEENVYDAVIDTVGGRRVWDACRRVMCVDAHFTTLVGDSSDTVPSINAHVKSSFRSLSRAFAKRDKALAYQWVSPAADLDHEGEDIKHSLTAVAELAAAAAYNNGRSAVHGYAMLPRVTCSFPLERAPDAFAVDETGRGPLIGGGTVVVRVL